MIFRHPEFLYFMLPALVILFYFLLTQKEHVSDYFSEDVMKKLRVTSNMLTQKARNGLFFTMFVFIIIALADPAIEDGKVKVEAKSADIMIALDISDSMLASDAAPSRLIYAKEKILSFLKQSDQQRIGVMAFAKEAYLVAPLSFDHKAISFLLKQLNPDSITEQGTSFMQLLFSTSQTMSENENRNLLIVTDGGDQGAFDKEIAKAKEYGIKVFILAVGTEKGAPIRRMDGSFIRQNGTVIISHLNTKIKALALETGGAYIEAVRSDDDVKAMLKEINAKTSKVSLAQEEVTRYIPLFYYPLGMAMILFILATSSMSKRKEVATPLLLLGILYLMPQTEARAGVFDFQTLDAAKTAYNEGDFNRSAHLYNNYLQENNNSYAQYDYANALYKNKEYGRAAKAYEKVNFEDKNLDFLNAHNLGNAYAKQGNIPALKKAITAYEKALNIKESKETRENLEKVKALLKEKEQTQDKKQNQKQNKEQNKKQDKSDSKDQNKSKNNQDKSDKNSQPKENKDKKDSDKNSKDKKSPEDKSQQNKDKKKDAGEKQKDTTKKDKQHDQDRKNEGSKETPKPDKKKLDKDKQAQQDAKDKAEQKSKKEKKQPKSDAGVASPEPIKEPIMSKREATKWLKKLNEEKIGHLYQLKKMDATPTEDNNDEKPW